MASHGRPGCRDRAELQLNTGFTDVPILAPDHRLDVQFYGFYDFGRVYNLGPGEFDQTVDSIGIGARSDLTSWLFVELAGVRRLMTRPNGANVASCQITCYSRAWWFITEARAERAGLPAG